MLNTKLAKGFASSLSLAERLNALPSQGTVDQTVPTEELLADWLEHHPSLDSFFERLTQEGIDRHDFERVLNTPADEFDHVTMDWSHALLDAYKNPNAHMRDSDLGLGTVALPIVNEAIVEIRATIQGLQHVSLDATSVLQSLLKSFSAPVLTPILMRTMILEMNVARLQGYLKGDTKEQRYTNYVDQLKDPQIAINLLQEYAPLARYVWDITQQWAKNTSRVLQRLDDDAAEIHQQLGINLSSSKLTRIEGGAGDAHRGGQTVMILYFDDGKKLVYKPKSLAVDKHFQDLLSWINQQDTLPPFKTLKMVDRNDYGWVEFIETMPCTDKAQLRRFYERQGAYLALLYCTEAVDFHLENLIAHGEYPMLIDLESLFHGHIVDQTGPEGVRKQAIEAVEYSVLRIGLLPQRIMAVDNSDGIDMSGMSGTGGQLSPFESPAIAAAGTDEMRLTRKRFEIQGADNLPQLDDQQPVNVIEFLDDIIDGFEKMYHLLSEKRHTLLDEQGVFSRFADDEIRLIVRPTRYYGRLMTESYHPDLLRDALDREAFFEHVWRYGYSNPALKSVLPYERRAMLQGDVPYFTTTPSSCNVLTGDGEVITDFFKDSPLTSCEKRLNQFSEEDLERQKWFIRASFAAMTVGVSIDTMVAYKPFVPQIQLDKDMLLSAAKAVGGRLKSLALRGEEDSTWLGISLLDDRNWSLAPLGADFYSGLTGITFFLAYLGHITHDEEIIQLAKEAFNTCQGMFITIDVRGPQVPVGYFSGVGGMVALLTHLGVLWNDDALLEQAQDLLPIIANKVKLDDKFDIIDGAAGCLISLLNLYTVTDNAEVLAVARLCGDRLVENAQEQPTAGVAWQTGATKDFLVGFSHGTAGIAKALLDLARVTGEQVYSDIAREAIRYERTQFSEKYKNWPDLRAGLSDANEDDHFMVAWCHGATGVGLSRLACQPMLTDDPMVEEEIRIALDTTLDHGFAINHSLCHGGLGNLELVLMAAQQLDDPALTAAKDDALAMIMESVQRYGWLTGVPRGIESPGLMTGIAGIGYAFLRLYAPEQVPSILLLEAPYG